MRVGHMTPNIIRFTYRQEKGDPGYGSCLWAFFDFDLDYYELRIHSDCGCYGYTWLVTPSEPFLELMARIYDGYLLHKLCKKVTVDWQATREAIFYALREQDDLSEEEIDSAFSALDEIADDYDVEDSVDVTTILVERWNEEYCRMDDIWEYIQTKYDDKQRTIVKVFVDYIQPAIREYLKSR
jgi:hypothetical protein